MKKKKKNASKPVIRCAKDVAGAPYQAFRLSSDGERKWQAVCTRRRVVLQHLALAANQNGKSVCLGAERIAAETGFGRATVFRILRDLRELGFLTDDGKWHPTYHTRVRAIDVPRVKAAKPSQIKPEKQPSQIKKEGDKNDMRAKQPSQIKKQPSQINVEPSQINSEPSQMMRDPTEELTEEHTEERTEDPAQDENAQIEPSHFDEVFSSVLTGPAPDPDYEPDLSSQEKKSTPPTIFEKCPDCDGTGFVQVDPINFGKGVIPCRCRQRKSQARAAEQEMFLLEAQRRKQS